MSTTHQNITVSLEWAKKLKEAGWPYLGQYFCAVPVNDGTADVEYRLSENNHHRIDALPVPTAEEILRRLPVHADGEYDSDRLTFEILKSDNFWYVSYEDTPRHQDGNAVSFNNESLANAAAAMYCYLVKNRLLPPTI